MEIMVQTEHARAREEVAMKEEQHNCVTVTVLCAVFSCLTFTFCR